MKVIGSSAPTGPRAAAECRDALLVNPYDSELVVGRGQHHRRNQRRCRASALVTWQKQARYGEVSKPIVSRKSDHRSEVSIRRFVPDYLLEPYSVGLQSVPVLSRSMFLASGGQQSLGTRP